MLRGPPSWKEIPAIGLSFKVSTRALRARTALGLRALTCPALLREMIWNGASSAPDQGQALACALKVPIGAVNPYEAKVVIIRKIGTCGDACVLQ